MNHSSPNDPIQIGTRDSAQEAVSQDAVSSEDAVSSGEAVSLEEVRDRLDGERGAKYWRSLEDLSRTPAFVEMMHREFPRHATEWGASVDRRRFLQISGAGLALAGLTGCTRQPMEQIVAYVEQPENVIPGNPVYFATTQTLAGLATGVLAESHLGRPTKIEGSPEHPASLGKTDIFAQASVLGLYDPDRSQAVVHLGRILTWTAFVDEMAKKIPALQALEGEGLRILTGTVTSPTVAAQLKSLMEAMPKARWYQHEPAGRDSARGGATAAFGEAIDTRYDFLSTDVVVGLDSDFLTVGPGAVRYAKDFAARRRVIDPHDAHDHGMNRFYSVESLPTSTSTSADHRLVVKPTEVAHFALALAAKLGVAGASVPASFASGERAKWLDAVAEDLQAHGARSAVVPGEQADPEVHALAHAINVVLGNVGTAVHYSEPVEAEPIDQGASVVELVEEMNAGSVDTLLILGVNPVYDTPADLDFIAALEKVANRVHLGTHNDETSQYCQWHVPMAHELESWTDARAFDGTVSIGQPIIDPLYGGKTVAEVLSVLQGVPRKSLDLMQEYWQQQWDTAGITVDAPNFERAWRKILHDGFISGSEAPAKTPALDAAGVSAAAQAVGGWSVGEVELIFRPDPTVFDGRFANNGWLQECPKPITKLTWDNALLMSPKTAREKGFGDLLPYGDQEPKAPMASLTVAGRSLELPVWVVPGMAEGVMALHLGYGRTHGGKVGEGAGFNAYSVRSSSAPWRVSSEVAVSQGSGDYLLASTQDHHSMEGRDLVRSAPLQKYLDDPHAVEPHYHMDVSKSLMPEGEFPYDGYAWGMTIDLGACTGCNACLVACQSENNIPVIGKVEVSRGREMHWIRVDRYFEGEDVDHVNSVVNQPIPCMQCEQAPCEVVCPVAATVHSDEGLNDMVYNRCVGTRYCSNNCPYKVRRFNFFLYQDWDTPSVQLGRNPDVTVRSRGVMEKCTYCVQRINQARIDTKREGRKIADGEVVTACQQACPSDAIAFGDINGEKNTGTASQVEKNKKSPLNYSLLAELGTRPRTTYLTQVRNPNPKLEPQGEAHGGGGHHG